MGKRTTVSKQSWQAVKKVVENMSILQHSDNSIIKDKYVSIVLVMTKLKSDAITEDLRVTVLSGISTILNIMCNIVYDYYKRHQMPQLNERLIAIFKEVVSIVKTGVDYYVV